MWSIFAWRGEKAALLEAEQQQHSGWKGRNPESPYCSEMLRKLKKTSLNSLPSVSLFSNYTDSGAAARVILIQDCVLMPQLQSLNSDLC